MALPTRIPAPLLFRGGSALDGCCRPPRNQVQAFSPGERPWMASKAQVMSSGEVHVYQKHSLCVL